MRGSLKKFLNQKRIELFEEINDLKDEMIYNGKTDDLRLNVAEAQMAIIKSVIDICEERGKY